MMADAPAVCPCCGGAFRGEPIRLELRAHYPPDVSELFQLFAVFDGEMDRLVAWECADCGHRWPRE